MKGGVLLIPLSGKKGKREGTLGARKGGGGGGGGGG